MSSPVASASENASLLHQAIDNERIVSSLAGPADVRALANPVDASAFAAAADSSLGLVPCSPSFNVVPNDGNMVLTPPKLFLGFNIENGGLDYSGGLSIDDSNEAIKSLLYFANLGLTDEQKKQNYIPDGFFINLRTLTRENGDPLVPEPGKEQEFKEHVEKMRKMAKVTIGENLSFTDYPIGHCTSLSHPPAFDTDHSERLKNLKFEDMHLASRLDKLRAKDDTEYSENRTKVLAMYHTTKGLMDASEKLLNSLLEDAKKNDPLTGSSRARSLSAILEKPPQEALTLFGATHYVNPKQSPNEYLEELNDVKKEATGFIAPGGEAPPSADRTWKTGKECLVYGLTLGRVDLSKISDENQKTENRVAAETALLSTYDRTTRVRGSNALGAEERRDGKEKFFVQLAYNAVHGQDGDVGTFLNSAMADLMLRGMDPVDQKAYKKQMGEIANGFKATLGMVRVVPKGQQSDADINEKNNAFIKQFNAEAGEKFKHGIQGMASQRNGAQGASAGINKPAVAKRDVTPPDVARVSPSPAGPLSPVAEQAS